MDEKAPLDPPPYSEKAPNDAYPQYQPQGAPSLYPTQPAPVFAPAYVPAPGPDGVVHVNNMYSEGARFDQGASKTIPPPPPGCMPNAAQQASSMGYKVQGTQKKQGFW